MVNAIRRNHALEHATVSILLSHRRQHSRVIGLASRDGFYVYSDVPTESLSEFAHEGLIRLQRGESHLAVSPLCGTNLAVAGILPGLASYTVATCRSDRSDGLPTALMAGMIAVLAAQPLGRVIQKRFTTLAELDGVRIVSVEPLGNRISSVHKVRTEYSATWLASR